MALLTPSDQTTKTQLRIQIDRQRLEKMNAYCQWAGIQKIDEFIEQAAELVFKKDRDWRKQKAPTAERNHHVH